MQRYLAHHVSVFETTTFTYLEVDFNAKVDCETTIASVMATFIIEFESLIIINPSYSSLSKPFIVV